MSELNTTQKETMIADNSSPIIQAVYLDGVLKEGDSICGNEGSFGMFMHSLVLSSTGNNILPPIYNSDSTSVDELYKTAATDYIKRNGFNSSLIISVTPKLTNVVLDEYSDIKLGAYQINDQIRIVGMGTAKDMLKYCSDVIVNSKFVKATRKIASKTYQAVDFMMNKGLSVYAIAIRDINITPLQGEQPKFNGGFALVALVGV